VSHVSTPARERTATVSATVDELVDRVRALVAQRAGRTMLGLVGAPGAGKSTLASALESRLADFGAVVVPFDGFHLAEVTLARLGLQHRKGALDTFDLDGYAHLLARLRTAESIVYAPCYDRSIEEPVAGAVAVPAQCRLVITEGNYLLADHPAARRAREALDAVWFLDLDERTRTERLVRRHIEFGKAPDAAEDWVSGVDQVNADLVAGTRDRADLVVQVRDGA
jgi:pantothenate kinase